VQKPIRTGMVGDHTTEATGGLNEGDQILMPQAQVSPGSGGNRSGGAGWRRRPLTAGSIV